MSARLRTAHPYRDLDVVDARAPRFNQATVGIVSLVAVGLHRTARGRDQQHVVRRAWGDASSHADLSAA